MDDGARTVTHTVDGVGRMVEAGIRAIVTTPHFDASLTLDDSSLESRLRELDEAWALAEEAVEKAHPGLDFRRGLEVKLDVPDGNFSDDRLLLGGTRFMLVEWPRMRVPPGSTEVLARLRFAGIRPIVAHPERYQGLDPRLDLLASWKEAGAYLQVNHGSLLGRYGPEVRTMALRILKRGWADYLSTDFHGRPHLELYVAEARERMDAIGGGDQFDLLASTNPLRVMQDQEPVDVPPLAPEKGFWGRVRELLGGEVG